MCGFTFPRQYRAKKRGGLVFEIEIESGVMSAVWARRDDGPKRKETQEDGRDGFWGFTSDFERCKLKWAKIWV